MTWKDHFQQEEHTRTPPAPTGSPRVVPDGAIRPGKPRVGFTKPTLRQRRARRRGR